MKSRIIKIVFAAMLKQASLLCAEAFAVIAAQFRCSADRFRCYSITAKNSVKALIEQRNISNKTPQNAPKKFSFPVLSLLRPINRESGGIRSLAEIFDDIPTRRLSA